MYLLPIGVIRTPWLDPAAMPIQPAGAQGVLGQIELRPDLADGLLDLAGVSHSLALYGFHRAAEARLTVRALLGQESHGVFATRAPTRPNPLGVSVLRLLHVKKTTLEVERVDMLDGTPLYDIKPFVPAFDVPEGEVHCGWLEDAADDVVTARSDGRFIQGQVRKG